MSSQRALPTQFPRLRAPTLQHATATVGTRAWPTPPVRRVLLTHGAGLACSTTALPTLRLLPSPAGGLTVHASRATPGLTERHARRVLQGRTRPMEGALCVQPVPPTAIVPWPQSLQRHALSRTPTLRLALSRWTSVCVILATLARNATSAPWRTSALAVPQRRAVRTTATPRRVPLLPLNVSALLTPPCLQPSASVFQATSASPTPPRPPAGAATRVLRTATAWRGCRPPAPRFPLRLHTLIPRPPASAAMDIT